MKLILKIIFMLFLTSSTAQVGKDTLYFNYDPNYILEYSEGKILSIKDTRGDEESFIFIKEEFYYDLRPTKILDLQKYIRLSSFYREKKHIKLDDYKLSRYLQNYHVFLVKKEKGVIKYVKVFPSTEIH